MPYPPYPKKTPQKKSKYTIIFQFPKPQTPSFSIIFSWFISSKHHQFPWISLGFLQTPPFPLFSQHWILLLGKPPRILFFLKLQKSPLEIAEDPSGFPSISFISASNPLRLLEMAEVFEDEIDQTVTIEEYIKGVEEQELVIYLCFTLVFGGFFFTVCVYWWFCAFEKQNPT